MSRHTVSLKCRIRYEGRVRTFDRRTRQDAELERLPEPLWYTVSQVLRANFRRPVAGKLAARK